MDIYQCLYNRVVIHDHRGGCDDQPGKLPGKVIVKLIRRTDNDYWPLRP